MYYTITGDHAGLKGMFMANIIITRRVAEVLHNYRELRGLLFEDTGNKVLSE